jgi:2'-5' RNA ligase
VQTGLVLALPALDASLRRWRRRDPAARLGMPAHVTLIYPFMDSRSVDDDVRARLRDLSASLPPLELQFDRIGDFRGGLWLELAEPRGVLGLISALAEAFPDWPPYGGAFETPVPHLTIAQAPEPLLAPMRREVPRVLPLAARAEAVSLYARFDEGWVPIERFALGASA